MRIDRACKYEAWALSVRFGASSLQRVTSIVCGRPVLVLVRFPRSLHKRRKCLFHSLSPDVATASVIAWLQPFLFIDQGVLSSDVSVLFTRWSVVPLSSVIYCWPAPSRLWDWERPSLFRCFDSVRDTIILFCSTKRGNYFMELWFL